MRRSGAADPVVLFDSIHRHGRRRITMISKLTKLTKKGFMGEFFASLVSFEAFVKGLR